MKFNLTESERQRILNLHMEKGYRQPINEDLLPSDFGTPQPHKAEDFVELDYDSSNETVVLYFNDETTETFQIDTRASYSPGEESSYDSPGYDADFEVVISSVKQVEPIERTWEVRQFEDYLQSLGAMEQLNDTLHNEDAYDSAAESYYDRGYDEDAYRDRDLDEDLLSPEVGEKYFARHGNDSIGWTGSSNSQYKPDMEFGDDFDDETYDDFDTLHTAHPDFHSHYSGKGNVDRARNMFNAYKEKHGPLNLKRRRGVNEGFDVQGNAAQMYDMLKNQFGRALNELNEAINKGDKEMSLHMAWALRHLLRRMDEAVQDLKKS